jgi:hypothetical protein
MRQNLGIAQQPGSVELIPSATRHYGVNSRQDELSRVFKFRRNLVNTIEIFTTRAVCCLGFEAWFLTRSTAGVWRPICVIHDQRLPMVKLVFIESGTRCVF